MASCPCRRLLRSGTCEDEAVIRQCVQAHAAAAPGESGTPSPRECGETGFPAYLPGDVTHALQIRLAHQDEHLDRLPACRPVWEEVCALDGMSGREVKQQQGDGAELAAGDDSNPWDEDSCKRSPSGTT